MGPESGCWVCPRLRHSAAEFSRASDLLIVHPFHVLSGRRVPVLFAKRRAGKVVFVCEGGPLGRVTVPQAWTDRGPAVAGHRFSVEALVELDTLRRVLERR
jgi:hypothetical protein